MRARAMLLVLACLLAACSSGDGDTGAFCDAMERFTQIAETALTDPEVDFEALDAQIQEVITEAEEAAPEQIADIIDSTDPADQDEIVAFVSSECGVQLPEF